MLGAIYVGLSGMEAFSRGLQTISNNVANLDTLGYKASSVSFSDIFGENAYGLSYASGQSGGSSGNGVKYNPEKIDFTQGTLQQTGNPLDLSLQGNGFLVVKNESGDTFYTRTGQFSIDSKGYITNQNGDRLTLLDGSNQLQVVNVNDQQTNPPVATTAINFSGFLLSSTTTAISVPNITVHDSTGASHVWAASFDKVASTDTTSATVQWTVTIKEGDTTVGTGTIAFNTANGTPVTGSSSIIISTTPNGASPMAVTLDFKDATTYSTGAASTLQVSKVDGNAAGSLTSVTVDSTGHLVLNYSNSQTTTLGAIAIADFQNQQDLVRVGSGLFKNTGKGELLYKSSGTDGIGSIQTGQVETSNVNLTAEFGNLILIQRGFDASSQVVSASNDMIQQLFGMRGHG